MTCFPTRGSEPLSIGDLERPAICKNYCIPSVRLSRESLTRFYGRLQAGKSADTMCVYTTTLDTPAKTTNQDTHPEDYLCQFPGFIDVVLPLCVIPLATLQAPVGSFSS